MIPLEPQTPLAIAAPATPPLDRLDERPERRGRSNRRQSAWRNFSRVVDRCARWADPCCRTWPRLIASASVVGLVPLLLAWCLESPLHQPVTALALAPLLWSCARSDAPRKGMVALTVAFAVHSAAAIVIAVRAPDDAAIFPDGRRYWDQQLEWITTGRDPEYEVKTWAPTHARLLGATTLFSFTSLGVVTLERGFHEVDVMNHYNGRLWNISRSGPRGLVWGWHIWSLLRGAGYVLLTYEIVSLALQVFLGRRLCTWRDRRWRWSSGLVCLAADAGAKFLLLEVVRRQLFENLL